MGIEPTALAWEARVLPLYDARRARYFTEVSIGWGVGIVVSGVKSVSTSEVFAGFTIYLCHRATPPGKIGRNFRLWLDDCAILALQLVLKR